MLEIICVQHSVMQGSDAGRLTFVFGVESDR
jgi:hypothetical protein